MELSGLSFSDQDGEDRGYRGLWIGNVKEPFGDEKGAVTLRSEMFSRVQKDTVVPTSVIVPNGVPILAGALSDADGVSPPQGVVVTVTKPDGTVLDKETAPTADGVAVYFNQEGQLVWFVVQNPLAGEWTITVSGTTEQDPEFQLFVSTLPIGDDEHDITSTLESAFQNRFQREHVESLIERYELVSWGCYWCEIGAWALALVIVIVVTAAAATLTEGSAVVGALATFAVVSEATALTWIRSAIAVLTLGVNAAVTHICEWTGACGQAGGYLDALIPNAENPYGISDSPALAVYKDKLYCVRQGVDNSGWIWCATFDGTTWSEGPVNAG